MSTADRFIAVMGDIQRMDHGLPDDAEERYAIWRLKDAAEASIADAISAAQRHVDSCRLLREAAKDIRAETEVKSGVATNDAKELWLAACEEAECVVQRGEKLLLMTEEMVQRIGAALGA